MPGLTGKPVLILGAGVAGLAVALALARRGAAVQVLDQAPVISEVGAGLQISPNGARVLAALGLDPGAFAGRAQAVILHDHRARPVTRMDLPQSGPGFWLAHRADLIGALLGAARAAGVAFRLGVRVEAATAGALTLAGGGRMAAPLILGADGVQSVVRQALNGASAPRFTGQAAWRALIPCDDPTPIVRVYMGPGRHLVSYSLRGGRIRNLVAVEERAAWTAEGWSHLDDPAVLSAAFAGFGGPVPGWLAQVQTVNLWGLHRHPVAPIWADAGGNLAILGDAAHPTLPFLAQGANLALEDAWELAAALEAPGGLAAWAAHRAPRAARVVAAADRNARAYHLAGPAAWVGHTALRVLGRVAPGAALRRFAWVHGYDAVAAAQPSRPMA